ncbi:Pentatricopeptide repeat-containing protein [Rhynchospora pubera]|uniref:Pentatricopeptide repeat-containing protein n=1 Tax=Rhynchospora pubera TaxID=906938 RepID=A0AAV8GZZ7_9POAL|nr:Pentatricopeptide repeat-containing protein [Rhynchospora pubera]
MKLNLEIEKVERLLCSCKCLPSLRRLHARLLTLGALNLSLPSISMLITSYSSFLQPHSSLAVFRSIPHPSLSLCNFLIRSLTRASQPRTAILLYHHMRLRGIHPDNYTFTFALQACAHALDSHSATSIHQHLDTAGLANDLFISTALLHLYSKLGLLPNARQVFDSMPTLDAVAWNAMIAAFSRNRASYDALHLFRRMQAAGHVPNSVTLFNLFPAVSHISALILCKQIHAFAIRRCILSSIYNALIDAYCKCGSAHLARTVFDDAMSSARDGVSWGTMISGYVHNGFFARALDLFDAMRIANVKLNPVAVLGALKAAGEIPDLDRGEDVHDYSVRNGLKFDIEVNTALVIMYAKCGATEKAKAVFANIHEKDVVAWSAIISSFAQNGSPKQALLSLKEMQVQGVKPNRITLVSALPACAELSDIKLGKSIHCFMFKSDMILDGSVGPALIAMYCKCESFGLARAVFDRLNSRDVVAWNALINGYTQADEPLEALQLFRQLRMTGKIPDCATFVAVLPAFALLSDLKEGASVHGMTIKYGFHSDLRVKNATLDLYAKCGDVQTSHKLFAERKACADIVSWNTMIAGYMHNGQVKQAMMENDAIEVDALTYLGVLSACRHGGLVAKGRETFDSMIHKKGLRPNVKHYACMVDLLGRAGQLDEAWRLIQKMPIDPDASVWGSLLGACRMHGNSKLGEMVLEQLARLAPNDGAHYVVLSSIYAQTGRWEDLSEPCKAGLKLPGKQQKVEIISEDQKIDLELSCCEEHERDLFVREFHKHIIQERPTSSAAEVCKNLSSLAEYVKKLIPSLINQDDVQLLRVFTDTLRGYCNLQGEENTEQVGAGELSKLPKAENMYHTEQSLLNLAAAFNSKRMDVDPKPELEKWDLEMVTITRDNTKEIDPNEDDRMDAPNSNSNLQDQRKKRKRNIMNDVQIELIERALLDEPEMQRNAAALQAWADTLSCKGSEITPSQLKNWLNNRKARLARVAKETRHTSEGENPDSPK